MRNLFLIGVIGVGLLWTLRFPFAGILLWTWFTCMQPHQLTFGFSTSAPLNLIIAAVTAAAWLASKERKLPKMDATLFLTLLFLVWITTNGFFAVDPAWSWPLWDRTWKTIALEICIFAMATNRVRIHALVWAVVVSLLYYGIKGGIFTIVTAGHSHVQGGTNTYIGDNNQLALALLMVLPLVNYLRIHTADRRIALGLAVAMALTALSVLGSYSRGAFLALGALAVAAMFRSRNKLLYLIAVVTVTLPAFYFMPQSFYDRMNTIQSASDDGSFHGRVVAWTVAWDYARDHFPFGNGFAGSELPSVFKHYFPDERPHAAHSIYFEVLGDNGVIGLALYFAILILAFLNCTRIRKIARNDTNLAWAGDLAGMIQLSLFVFCVGGAALSFAYYDVYFIWVGLLCALRFQLNQAISAERKRESVAGFPHPSPATGIPDLAINQGLGR